MFYRVVVFEKRLEVEDRGIFASLEDAKTYKKLHKLELLDSENMDIIEYTPKTVENIPPQVYVYIETFVTPENNIKNTLYEKENRNWSIEKISTDIKPINIPSKWNKKVSFWDKDKTKTLSAGTAVIYQDDKDIISSFTIIFPISSAKLLNEELSKKDVLKIAENIFDKFCKAKPKEPILILEDF